MLTIESRWPRGARWRKVTASPHRERYPFNPETKVLEFISVFDATEACEAMRSANAGEFRIVSDDAIDKHRPEY